MDKRNTFIVLVFSVTNILFHLIFSCNLEYHRDELLYFSLGDHLSTGYYSVPPMIGWIAFVMKNLFGNSVFAVRLFPAILSGFLVYLTALSVKELGGKTFAIIVSCLGIIFMPVTLRAYHLFQPVHIDIFFWTLILFLTIKYFKYKNNTVLIYLGVVVGLSVLNKYLVVLLILSLLLSISLTDKRKLLQNKYLYLSFIISITIFLPNFLWQYNHGFPVFSHMTELNETQLANVDRWYFLSDQLLMGFTFSIFTVAGILFFLKNKSYRYLGLTSIFVIGTLLFLRGKSYYTIGMFPILLAGGSVYIEKIVKDWRLRTLFIILPVLLVLPILPLGVPIFKQDGLVNFFQKLEDKHGLIMGRRFEDGSIHSLPQDYADMLGWEELVMKVTIAFNEIPDKSQALIYAENYGQAGAINIIGKKYDLPSVVSFNESFIYWIPNRLENDIRYFIYVNDELGDDIQALFQTIVHIGEVTNIHAREYGTTVYLCSNPRSSFSLFYKEILDQL